jgi:hypothetical protein
VATHVVCGPHGGVTGYTDQWANMTHGQGPDGIRAVVLKLLVTMDDGSTHTLDTSDPATWEARTGPVIWDHFFHGETFDGSLDADWLGQSGGGGGGSGDVAPLAAADQAWKAARRVQPSATAPTGMQVR